MKKLLSLFALLMTIVIGAKAAGYTPVDDEIIILKDVYDANKTDAGYSKHAAIAWGGTASTNSKKAGDPYNEGEITSSNVPCYSVKGNGGGKNITVSISGVSKITIYHEKHSERYVELRDGDKSGTIIGQGVANTTFTEVELDASADYTIFLHGTKTGDDQDLNVYAIKLEPGSVTPSTAPEITKQPQNVEYEAGSEDYPEMSITAKPSSAAGALSYEWYANIGAPVDIKLSTIIGELAQNATIKYADLKDLVAPYVKPGFSLTMRCEVTEEGIADPVSSDLASVDVVVAKPVVSPASGTIFSESITMTATCVTEGTVLEYLDGNEWKPVGEGVEFTETVDELRVHAVYSPEPGTYVASEEVYVTYIKFTPEKLSSISDATTWTLTNNLEPVQLSNATTPKKYDTYYTYNDVALLTDRELPADFSGSTLAFSGEWPFRTSNGAQNCNLQFITTVPGTVSIEFSNTGGSNEKRWVKVNETVGTVEAKGTSHKTEDFTVGAGLVTISHVNEEGELSNGLRFYTVTFTPTINVTLGDNGYSTYCGDANFTVTSGATAYTATLSGTTVTLNEIAANTVIGKGVGIVLKGTEGDKAVLTVTTDAASSMELGNNLKGVNAETTSIEANAYVLASNGTNTSFVKAGTYGTVEALMNKAYIVYSGSLNSLDIQFEGEATAINNVDANDNANSAAPVKVIKNGKLFIGNYNVAGQLVK